MTWRQDPFIHLAELRLHLVARQRQEPLLGGGIDLFDEELFEFLLRNPTPVSTVTFSAIGGVRSHSLPEPTRHELRSLWRRELLKPRTLFGGKRCLNRA